MHRVVRCFLVLVHGRFEPRVHLGVDKVETHGFYTTRWVIAGEQESAVRKAFRSAERELQEWSDLSDGLIGLSMQAESVGPGSWWCWLRGAGKGFSFYIDD